MRIAVTYYDGNVAVGRSSWLVDDGDDLLIHDDADRELARWRTADVRLSKRPGDGGEPLRLCRRPPNLDRLVIGSPDDAAALVRRYPRLRCTGRMISPLRVGVWVLAAAISIALLVFVVIPALAERLANAVPATVEARLGVMLRDQFLRAIVDRAALDMDRPVCRTPGGDAVLERLAARLAAAADLPVEVRVTVANSKVVNAFALPGGQVVVTRSLLDFAEHPDELAGVIAHELGHVAHHHPTAAAIKHAGGALLIGLLIGDVAGGSAMAVAASTMLDARYSRDAEREADAYAAAVMRANGYDPAAAAAFLERLAREHRPKIDVAPMLSTHPQLAERQAILAGAATGATHEAMTPSDWRTLKAICADPPAALGPER
jgi:Putative Zn-dependent protease, contains TPR repeats